MVLDVGQCSEASLTIFFSARFGTLCVELALEVAGLVPRPHHQGVQALQWSLAHFSNNSTLGTMKGD